MLNAHQVARRATLGQLPPLAPTPPRPPTRLRPSARASLQVSSASALIEYGECDAFFGKRLDGHLCDQKRYSYE